MKRRQTIQRIKILGYLKSVVTHPTAEMVYIAAKKEIPTITLATVYRNLHLLADEGEISRLEINNEYRFDANVGKHQHYVCKKCGEILDVFQKEISEYALKKVDGKKFEPDTVQVIFYGLCKKCKK